MPRAAVTHFNFRCVISWKNRSSLLRFRSGCSFCSPPPKLWLTELPSNRSLLTQLRVYLALRAGAGIHNSQSCSRIDNAHGWDWPISCSVCGEGVKGRAGFGAAAASCLCVCLFVCLCLPAGFNRLLWNTTSFTPVQCAFALLCGSDHYKAARERVKLR